MKLFHCQICDQVLYFENTRCERCGHALGFLPGPGVLSALEPLPMGGWRALAPPGGVWRNCANAAEDACNWLVRADHPDRFCTACRHNRMVPDLTRPEHAAPWRRIQRAQHRLIYTLQRLRLPLATRAEDPAHGLVFDVLADPPDPAAPRVLTGHERGCITLALAEADDAERERRRANMAEPYRTLLGHVRHESGHYFWDLLVRDGGWLAQFRAVFGDDRADYRASLAAHYATGAPPDWQAHYVSAYAAAHPWEDFAETWAHYLHILDTLEMAAAFGLRVRPRVPGGEAAATRVDMDPYATADIAALIEAWLPLTYAANGLNRCMGAPDFYPFVLSPAAIGKLGFVLRLVQGANR